MNFESLVEQLILENLIKITGPALYYKPSKVLVKGGIGSGHHMLWDRLYRAMAKKMNISAEEAESKIDQNPKDVVDGFITSDGKFVDRTTAWEIARTYKQNVQQMHAARLGSPGKLASEYL
jgi:hypothetical protein